MLSWSKLIGCSENCVTIPLEAKSNTSVPYKKSIIEYTINHYRSKKFVAMSKVEQMAKYQDIIHHVMTEQKDCLINHVYYFEQCRDGTVHMHGRFNISDHRVWAIEGIIQMFVKTALKHIDGRLKWRDSDYYPRLERYRSPCLCVQHSDEFERIMYWEQYIAKEVNI